MGSSSFLAPIFKSCKITRRNGWPSRSASWPSGRAGRPTVPAALWNCTETAARRLGKRPQVREGLVVDRQQPEARLGGAW